MFVWSFLVPRSPKVELVPSLPALVWGQRLEKLLKLLNLKLKIRTVDLLLSGGKSKLFWVSRRLLLCKSSMLSCYSSVMVGWY